MRTAQCGQRSEDGAVTTLDLSGAGPGTPPVVRDSWRRERLMRVGRGIGSVLVGLAVVIVLWLGFIKLFDIDPLVAKSPTDVWHYIVTGGSGDEPASEMWHGLGRTLGDSGLGYVAGLVAAIVVALLFVVTRGVEQAFMPIAVTVRSVPLVAMTPVITLIFGRHLMATTVISGIVVFFPALVTITFGLRSAPRQTADLVRAYGGGGWAVARRVMVPSALPAVFASARVAVPGALIGGLLAEWLATGKGLGYLMLTDTNQFDYDQLWASVVVLTVTSILMYYAVGALEALVLSRFGPPPSKS